MTVEPGSVRWVTLYDDEHGFAPNYLQSLLPMIAGDLVTEQRLARGGWAFKQAKNYDIAAARNEATVDFLTTDVEWLLFIDADMGWEPDALERLLAVADPKRRPIVGALCFGYTSSENGDGEAQGPFRYPFPTVYDLEETDDDIGFRVRWHYRPSSLQRCGATGAAFLLIHRSALETMRDKHGETWWSWIKHPKAKTRWGEDTSFCVRAGICDIPVHVDTRVRTSHLKPIYVSEAVYMERIQAPPADVEVDVVVPVMGRPEHAARFMGSLRASTGLAHVTALANSDDAEVIDAWHRAGANVIVVDPTRTSFPQKCNDGYRATTRPWLLFVGSDVVFRPGWWDHALDVARIHGVDMVATNDLCNLDVRDGRLATHPVVRRAYIDAQGASWDGPGVVAHEGYRHCWVDAEWTTVAIGRGTFAPAFAAKVEHVHPRAGKALWDDTYQIGLECLEADREVFEERLGVTVAADANVTEWYRLFRDRPWQRPRYGGQDCQQLPADLERYAEVIVDHDPPFAVEIGRGTGGTALFLADHLAGDAVLISIDTGAPFPPHDRVTYLTGDSISPEIVAHVRAIADGRRGMVLLDGDHSSAQVSRELAVYPDLADYLVVEDTIMADLGFDDGPHLALARWLPEHPEFVVDPDPAQTQHPGGWLRRA